MNPKKIPLRKRIKGAWWILRNGLPSITYHAHDGVEYEMPDMTMHGWIAVYLDNGVMSGFISDVGKTPPTAHLRNGESFEMHEGPYRIGEI